MFDEFLSKIHDGRILSDVTFELRAWQGSEVVKVKYSGAWGLCDNGYHMWECMQAPCKSTAFLDEKRFSDWLESFRKVINDISSPETRPNKGRNTANNTLIEKLSYSNVSPKE